MELPAPIVIALDAPADSGFLDSGFLAWTSYVTPAATWGAQPVTVAFAGAVDAIDKGVPGDLRDLLDVSARAWSTPPCTAARFVTEATRPAAASGAAEDGRNDIIVHRTDWPAPLATGAAGHTVIYTLGDRIVEADIHLNARDFTFTVGGAPPKIDLQAILTHELGHVLGIGHSADARATMNAGLLSGIAARSLEKDDLAAVCALYPGTTGRGCSATDCPPGFSCVGFTCERDEPAVNGHACASASEVRRCEGAGDVARCVLTSIGERCARPCPPDCGHGLVCVNIGGAVDDSVCLPPDATVASDAGPDAPDASDAGAGTRPTGPTSESGCTCNHATRRTSPMSFLTIITFLIAWKLRTPRS